LLYDTYQETWLVKLRFDSKIICRCTGRRNLTQKLAVFKVIKFLVM